IYWKYRDAEREKNIAQEAKAEAERQRDENRRNLYAAKMHLAEIAWREAQFDRLVALLNEQRPQGSAADLRGFEWYYLWRLCHSELRTLQGHTHPVISVAFSPNGQRLATASDDRTVKVWDAATGRELRTLQGHTSVAFSPDGRHLASASEGKTVK